MNTLRTATKEDFKEQSVLIDSEGNRHSLYEKYADGIWNTRGGNVVFENEAHFYKIEG
jgi:hypothetical protein